MTANLSGLKSGKTGNGLLVHLPFVHLWGSLFIVFTPNYEMHHRSSMNTYQFSSIKHLETYLEQCPVTDLWE